MQFGDFSPVPLRFLLLFLVETGFVSALLQGGKTLTPPELDAFRSTFLSKMGVTSTPAAPFTASPIPNYLWDIYSAIRHGGRNGVNVPEFADCVRNYFPNQTIIDDQGLLHLHFNLSSEKSVTDQRLRVELRVRHPDILQNSPGRIALYEVIDGCRDVRRLLDTKVIKDMKKTDWISLDASPAVSRTLSLHLIVAMVDVNSTEHFANHSISSAAIVIFSVSEDSAKSARPKRSTAQETEADEEAQSRRRWKNGQAAQEPKIRSRVAPIRQICQRHAVYVDFVQLNWQDWILAPAGYEAYYCDGICAYPLTERLNASNHAIVQSLVHSVSRSAAPAPCCVPTETDQLSILYIDVDNRIIIKNYPDMRVTGCGCR